MTKKTLKLKQEAIEALKTTWDSENGLQVVELSEKKLDLLKNDKEECVDFLNQLRGWLFIDSSVNDKAKWKNDPTLINRDEVDHKIFKYIVAYANELGVEYVWEN